MRVGRVPLLTLAVAAAVFMTGSATARGGTVSYHADEGFRIDSITYRAVAGEVNQLRLYHDSALHERLRMVNLTDGANVLVPAAAPGEAVPTATLTQCVVAPVSAAYCHWRDVVNDLGFFYVTARLGDGSDLGRVSYVAHPGYNLFFSLHGEGGDDQLVGSPEADSLDGGSGADLLDGGSGADDIEAGRGVDRIYAGAGDDFINVLDGQADTVDCGTGTDTVRHADAADSLTGCEVVTY